MASLHEQKGEIYSYSHLFPLSYLIFKEGEGEVCSIFAAPKPLLVVPASGGFFGGFT